jgi:hypothetical protein
MQSPKELLEGEGLEDMVALLMPPLKEAFYPRSKWIERRLQKSFY